MIVGNSEGNPKYHALIHDDRQTGTAVQSIMQSAPDEMIPDCPVYPVIAYLSDHKAATLDRTLKTVEQFAAENDNKDVQFLPAAGSAGIEAVTNIVVKDAN